MFINRQAYTGMMLNKKSAMYLAIQLASQINDDHMALLLLEQKLDVQQNHLYMPTMVKNHQI
jgi:hypothetical protein